MPAHGCLCATAAKPLNEETSQRSALVLKEVRAQVDAAYSAIAERVNALMLLEGSGAHVEFIRRLNAVVEKYKNILARRRGRSAAKEEGEKQPQATQATQTN